MEPSTTPQNANANPETTSTEVASAPASPAINSDAVKQRKTPNKLLPVTIFLAILALAGTGFGVASWLINSGQISDLKEQVATKDEQLASLMQEIEASGADISDELLSQIANSFTQNNKRPTQNNTETTTTPLAKKLLITGEDNSQIIGGPDVSPSSVYITRRLNTAQGYFDIHLNRITEYTAQQDWGGGEAGTFLSCDFSNYPYRWTGDGYSTYTKENIPVENIDASQVVDIRVSGFGQAAGYETVFFLMSDGTVEYMPIDKAINENHFASLGKLPGVENAIMFNDTRISYGPYGASANLYAQRADGKLYSLYPVITETGNY